MTVGPRPGRKSIKRLDELGLTHLCTLLDEHEDARRMEEIANGLGCKWIWLPIQGGRIEVLRQLDLPDLLVRFITKLDAASDNRVYLHCSAGIAYIILRLRGMPPEDALAELYKLRQVTAEHIGEARLELAEQLVAEWIG